MKEYVILDDIPDQMNEPAVLYYLQSNEIDWKYLSFIKQISSFTDDLLSDWLNISVKTFRLYKTSKQKLKANIKEHILMILSVTKHGISVFGSSKAFEKWLHTPNFYFNNSNPESFMSTISGIRFVDERLTAIEFGDNV